MFWRYGQVWWEWPSHPLQKNDKLLRVGNCQEVESPKRETPFFQPQSFRYYLYSSFRQKYVTVHFEMLLQATSFRFCFSRDGPWKFTWNPKIEFWKISFDIFNHGWFFPVPCEFSGAYKTHQNTKNTSCSEHDAGEGWSHERWHHRGWRHTKQWQKRWNVGHLRVGWKGGFTPSPFGVAQVAVDVIGFSSMISIDVQVWGKKRNLHRCMRFVWVYYHLGVDHFGKEDEEKPVSLVGTTIKD